MLQFLGENKEVLIGFMLPKMDVENGIIGSVLNEIIGPISWCNFWVKNKKVLIGSMHCMSKAMNAFLFRKQ